MNRTPLMTPSQFRGFKSYGAAKDVTSGEKGNKEATQYITAI